MDGSWCNNGLRNEPLLSNHDQYSQVPWRCECAPRQNPTWPYFLETTNVSYLHRAILFYMPIRAYHHYMAGISSSQLWSSVANVSGALYSLLELLSFGVVIFVLNRRLRFAATWLRLRHPKTRGPNKASWRFCLCDAAIASSPWYAYLYLTLWAGFRLRY